MSRNIEQYHQRWKRGSNIGNRIYIAFSDSLHLLLLMGTEVCHNAVLSRMLLFSEDENIRIILTSTVSSKLNDQTPFQFITNRNKRSYCLIRANMGPVSSTPRNKACLITGGLVSSGYTYPHRHSSWSGCQDVNMPTICLAALDNFEVHSKKKRCPLAPFKVLSWPKIFSKGF